MDGLAGEALFQRGHVVDLQHPGHPAAAQFGAGADGLTEDRLLGGRVLQDLDDLEVAAAVNGENVVARAETRVEAAIGSDRFHCDTLARIDDAALRGCGVSGNKLLALRDLARREEAGEIPSLRRMTAMSDDDIVRALVPIRGIGRWTVEMMLMFRLGRPDVLPIDDLGIRKGAQAVDKSEAMPTPKALAARGERWGPYRSYASFYLWRIADAAAGAKQAVARSQD